MWANWHGRPSHEQFSPHIVTSVIRPANDATVSGTTLLDARAKAYAVTKVEYLLTDGSHHSKLIAGGIPTFYGWLADGRRPAWRTARTRCRASPTTPSVQATSARAPRSRSRIRNVAVPESSLATDLSVNMPAETISVSSETLMDT